jgi:hypothetical protein
MQQPPNNDPWQPPPQPNTYYSPQQPPYPTGGLPPPPNQPYQSYPQQPMYPPPPMPPKKRRGPLFWILLIIGALVICAACSGIGSAISHSSTATTNVSTNTSTAATPATDTPVPTDTPQPTAAPLTDKDAINNQVKSDIASVYLEGDSITAGYNKNAAVVVGLNPPVTMSQDAQLALVANDCFSAQKVIWQDPLLQKIGYLDVSVITQDSQGLPVVIGECVLDAQHASKIDWNNTDAATAWNNKIYSNMTPSN